MHLFHRCRGPPSPKGKTVSYDANNQLTGQSWQMGDTVYSQTFTYSKTHGNLINYVPAVGNALTLNYDYLQRLESITGGIYTKSYTYKDISDTQTTAQVGSLTYDLPTDITYSYAYDVLGNIVSYSDGSASYIYNYDSQNQLLTQSGGGKTYRYSYDAAGNILTSTDGTTSHTYTYGNAAWQDLLTAFDGQPISYDASGNPTSYYNGTRYTFTWEEGRRLVSASGGGNTVSYTYDSDGLRTSKTVGTVRYEYLYASGTLLRETCGDTTLDFFYDASGYPYALNYTVDGTTTLYYYITNLQGDVLHIADSSGNIVVTYSYDPYGKLLSTTGSMASTLGTANPLRYRGYYYDSELSLYYLQSRYYDPSIGRFINADSQFDKNAGYVGLNLFSYCANNPIVFKDISGESIIGACVFIGFAIGALYGGHKGAEVSKQELGYVDGYYVAAGIAIYGGIGALVGWGFGAAATALGVGTTVGTYGSLTPGLYQSWQQAEQALRAMFDGISRAVNTPYGRRVLDCLSGRTAYEAKYGYTCLTQFIQNQIAKDIYLLQSGYVDYVEWHFFWSDVSNSGGASQQLIQALINAGIKVVFH